MSLIEKYRVPLILILAAVIIAGAVLLIYRQTIISGSGEIVILPPPFELWVYVEGEVEDPGVYKLRAGTLVADAVEIAGGFSAAADRASVNLASIVRDGDHIHIYRTGEIPQKININTAEVWLLESLPGIGDTLAQRIVEFRTANGFFQQIEDLLKVEGMGFKVLEQIREKVTVH